MLKALPRKRIGFRRVSENAFRILVSVLRIFSTTINVPPDKATKVDLAALILHNMLRLKSSDTYTPVGFADEVRDEIITEGHWRRESMASIIRDLPARCRGNNTKKEAENVQNHFADHLPW